MSELVRCFEQLIHPEWLLERQGGEWLLRESQARGNQHSLLRIQGGPSLAFSLDKSGSDPWPFLGDKLPGIRKVSDAIVLTQKQDRAYVIAIEMKSRDESKASQQIHNARLFIDWLFKLLETRRHWQGRYEFCGIISFRPRNQERRGTTARAADLPKPSLKPGLSSIPP